MNAHHAPADSNLFLLVLLLLLESLEIHVHGPRIDESDSIFTGLLGSPPQPLTKIKAGAIETVVPSHRELHDLDVVAQVNEEVGVDLDDELERNVLESFQREWVGGRGRAGQQSSSGGIR